MRLEYFHLVDRIVDFDLANRTIRTQASVPSSSTIFEGHFPGLPLMPGVLLMELMAQTSGWLVIGLNRFSRMAFLAAFNHAKLRAFVSPGEALEANASIVHEGSGYARTKADVRRDGKTVCDAEITFRLIEFPNREFREHMEKAAAAIAFPAEFGAQGCPSHG